MMTGETLDDENFFDEQVKKMWLHSIPRFLEAGGGLVRRRVENLKELEKQYQVHKCTFSKPIPGF